VAFQPNVEGLGLTNKFQGYSKETVMKTIIVDIELVNL